MNMIWFTRVGGHIAESIHAKAMEWVLTLAAALFGFALFQPVSTFSLSPSWNTIALLAASMRLTEEMIGLSIILLAFIRLGILGYNGLWHASPRARGWISLMYAVLWLFVFFGMWSAVGFASTGTGIYLALTAGEVVNVARAFKEWGEVQVRRTRGRAYDTTARY